MLAHPRLASASRRVPTASFSATLAALVTLTLLASARSSIAATTFPSHGIEAARRQAPLPLPGSSGVSAQAKRVGPRRNALPASARPGGPQIQAGCATWTTLAPNVPSVARLGIEPIYDPVRDRMVVTGGIDEINNTIQSVLVCPLGSPPAWSTLAVAGTPPPILYHYAAVYDPPRDRILYIGGWPVPGLNYPAKIDVWSLSLSGTPSWLHLAPLGSGPEGRDQSFAIYDSFRDRVVFGGGNVSGFTGDAKVWALSLTGTPTWTPLTPAGTPPSYVLRDAVYDAPRDRLVCLGPTTDHVFALTFSGTPSWTELVPAGTPPTKRLIGAVMRDAPTDRMLVYAGSDDLGNNFNDCYALTLAGTPTWSLLNPPEPKPMPSNWPGAMIDPVRNRLVAFGGFGSQIDEVWALSLGGSPAWSQLNPTGAVPIGRFGHTTIFDKPRNRLVMFGGIYGGQYTKNDVWVYDLAGTNGWTLLIPTGTRPSPRLEHTAVFDSVRNRMVVFGGSNYYGLMNNEVWALSLSGTPAWTQLNPSGTAPPARRAHGAVHDRARNRMVAFSGVDNDGTTLTDVWALALNSTNGSWSQLATTGATPFGELDYVAGAYDPLRDRIVFTGTGDGSVRTLSMSTLAYGVLLATGGTLPTHTQGLVYDPFADRIIGDEVTGAWVLTLSGTPTAGTMVGTHIDHYGGTLVFDTPRNRAVLSCGNYSYNDVLALGLTPGLRGLGTQIFTIIGETDVPEGGTLQIDPMSGCFSNGATVTLTATAGPGFEFGGWSGSDSSNANPLVLTMDTDKYLVAYFVSPGVWAESYSPTAYADSGDAQLVVRGFNFGPETSVRFERAGGEPLPAKVTGFTPDGRKLYVEIPMWDATPDFWYLSMFDFARGVMVDPSFEIYPAFHLTDVYPAGGRNGGPHTFMFRGKLFQPGATAFLRRVGQPDIVGTGIVVAPDGNSLTATLDLTGRPIGLWDAYVVNPGDVSAGRGAAFGVVDVNAVEPDVAALRLAVAPNPVRNRLQLDFTVTQSGLVDAALFDLQGRRVTEMVHALYVPGRHQAAWPVPRDMASGVYFVVWHAEGQERRVRVALTH